MIKKATVLLANKGFTGNDEEESLDAEPARAPKRRNFPPVEKRKSTQKREVSCWMWQKEGKV